jgi:hypothetical protein
VTATSRQPEGLGHVGRSVETLELRVFDGDATLRFLAARDVAPGVLLLLAPIFILSLVVISAADGHLTTQNLPALWCQDAGHYLFSPNWPCLKDQTQSAAFPLLRDLPSLGCATILGISPYLVYSQWFGIRDLYLEMFRQGLISFRDDIPEAERLFRHEIASANDYFARAGRRSAAAMAIAATSILFVVASQRYGVFPSIAPSAASSLTQSAWSKDAYVHWWANFDFAIPGWLAYCVIGTIGLYFIITMNVIGSRVVFLIWRTRSYITYGADPDNRDEYFGWLQARRILAPTYIALAVHGLGIFLTATMVPPGVLWFLVPVAGQWLLVLGPYIYIPMSLVTKNIRAYREKEAARLVNLLDDLALQPMSVQRERDRETVAQRLERVRSIRSLPFRRFGDLSLLSFTIFSSVASLYGVAALWYNIA